jgi:hypothetical protein
MGKNPKKFNFLSVLDRYQRQTSSTKTDQCLLNDEQSLNQSMTCRPQSGVNNILERPPLYNAAAKETWSPNMASNHQVPQYFVLDKDVVGNHNATIGLPY